MQFMYDIVLLSCPYLVKSNEKQGSELRTSEKRKYFESESGELRNICEMWKYEGSTPYCRCSAISLCPDISHINHFSQINTEQDEALLPFPHPNASQHRARAWYTFSSCLSSGGLLIRHLARVFRRGLPMIPCSIVSARCHLNTRRVTNICYVSGRLA